MRVVLTRHGHVEGILPERFRGRMELELTELGQAEAKAVAQRIAAGWRPSVVYTSPMGRCVAIGQEIASACGIDLQVLPGLNDLDYGQWQWRSHEEVKAEYPQLYAAWRTTPHLVRFPDGDSLQDLIARTADALRDVLASHSEELDTVVMVGHDSVNRALLLQLLDQPLTAYWRIAQAPCTINELEIVDSHIRALRVNETQHLEGLA